MTSLDEQTVAEMLRTSSPEGRRRFWDEVARGVPAHDHDPLHPRAYAVACGNPRCYRRVLVGGTGVGRDRHYCCKSCQVLARYWRDPDARDRKRAYQRAYSAAKRAVAA